MSRCKACNKIMSTREMKGNEECCYNCLKITSVLTNTFIKINNELEDEVEQLLNNITKDLPDISDKDVSSKMENL